MNAPPQPAPLTQRIPLRVLAAAIVSVFVVALAGCGGSSREPETISIVIPLGTQYALAAGEQVEVMPTRLEFRVGDTLHIRNEDDVLHSVGPYTVAAGAEFRLTYNAPGTYEGYCPLSEGERYEIVVEQ